MENAKNACVLDTTGVLNTTAVYFIQRVLTAVEACPSPAAGITAEGDHSPTFMERRRRRADGVQTGSLCHMDAAASVRAAPPGQPRLAHTTAHTSLSQATMDMHHELMRPRTRLLLMALSQESGRLDVLRTSAGRQVSALTHKVALTRCCRYRRASDWSTGAAKVELHELERTTGALLAPPGLMPCPHVLLG